MTNKFVYFFFFRSRTYHLYGSGSIKFIRNRCFRIRNIFLSALLRKFMRHVLRRSNQTCRWVRFMLTKVGNFSKKVSLKNIWMSSFDLVPLEVVDAGLLATRPVPHPTPGIRLVTQSFLWSTGNFALVNKIRFLIDKFRNFVANM